MPKYKKRSDGRYLIQIQIGLQENGKPKYKNIYAKTIVELEKKERDFRMELDRGVVIDDDGLTVAEWSDIWVDNYKSNLEYNTVKMYKNVINAHIKPALGNIKLKKLKAHHVQELINAKKCDFSQRTLEKINLTLRQIIKQAVINDFIYKDIMLGVSIPQKSNTEKRVLSDCEISTIRSANLPIKERCFLYMLLYTGLRRGEILALSLGDIELALHPSVTVNKSVYHKGNIAHVKNAPKSKSGFRTIPLTIELVDMLCEYKKTLPGLVLFPNGSGELMSNSYFRHFWKRIMSNLFGSRLSESKNIKELSAHNDITPHIFRHTYATILYNAGVDIKTAQYLLGHSKINITLDIYTHLDEKNKSSSLEKLEHFIVSQSVKNQSIALNDS